MGYHLPTADTIEFRDSGPAVPVTKYTVCHSKTAWGPIFIWVLSTKYTDSESGLVYYGYRYYVPEMGRWVSRDPVREIGGTHLYAFVRNDGVAEIDAIGFSIWDGNYNVDNLAQMLGFALLSAKNYILTESGKVMSEIKTEMRGIIEEEIKSRLGLVGCGFAPIGIQLSGNIDQWHQFGGQLFSIDFANLGKWGPLHYSFYTIGWAQAQGNYTSDVVVRLWPEDCKCHVSGKIDSSGHIHDTFDFIPDRRPTSVKNILYDIIAAAWAYEYNIVWGASRPEVDGDWNDTWTFETSYAR